jgi:excisionase family DNA binding protein
MNQDDSMRGPVEKKKEHLLDDLPKYARIADVAEALQISRAELYRMAYAGKIPVTRIGGMLRFPRDRLIKWVDARTEA